MRPERIQEALKFLTYLQHQGRADSGPGDIENWIRVPQCHAGAQGSAQLAAGTGSDERRCTHNGARQTAITFRMMGR